MRSNRSQNGGTLGLVAISIVIIGLVGVGLFYITRLLGGHRELDFATRSGNLNVAKQAIVNPAETLTSGLEQNNFAGLTDTDPIAGGGVNLRVYNRLVGQALLVALNAKADNGPTGKTNAANLINSMQSSNGIGGRLRNRLGSQGNTTGFFDFFGLRNSTRMLGQGNVAAAVYQPSWVEARATDIAATNILTPVPKQLPLDGTGAKTDIPDGFKRKLKQSDGKIHEYYRGYQGLDFGLGVPATLIGVPVQPGSQPHLVSSNEFAAGLNKFGSGKTFVPPNAFEYGSQKQDQYTTGNASSASRAVVGALSAEFSPSIPLGYLVINNPVGIPSPKSPKPPAYPGPLDNELDPLHGGIVVDSGTKMFTSDEQLMLDWKEHNKNPTKDCPTNKCKSPPVNNLFDASGNKATKSAAHSISPEGAPTRCTDMNSVDGEQGEGVSPCTDMLSDFGKAYPGDTDYVSPRTKAADSLTALESAKADVMDKFNSCGKLNLSNPTSVTTGLRKWACRPGQNCPWPQNGNQLQKAQISFDGTIGELFYQVPEQPKVGGKFDDSAGKAAKAQVESFITQRLYEIKPSATKDEIKDILNKPVPLAGVQYIYMGADKKLKFDLGPPPGLKTAQAADGTKHPYSQTYEANGSAVNPKSENHIHDQLFKCGQGFITNTDSADFTPSSGFNNNLGEFNFSNKITQQGAYYCCPD